MRKRILKCLKLLIRIIKLEFMTDVTYRWNFVFTFVGTSAWLISELLFLSFTLSTFGNIEGWNIYEVGLLAGVNEFWIGGAFFFVIWPSMRKLAKDIRTGQLDMVLIKPASKKFLVSISKFDFPTLGVMMNGLLLSGYCLWQLNVVITFMKLISFIFLILLTIYISYQFQFIVTCVSFWVTNVKTLQYSFIIVDNFARYPYEIFAKGLIFIVLTFILPATIVTNLPARALIGILELRMVAYAFLIAVFFTLIAKVMWKYGLKRYDSASS